MAVAGRVAKSFSFHSLQAIGCIASWVGFEGVVPSIGECGDDSQ